ncbi:hypothetical protein SAMN05421505_101150 [Sinosporangium album]|uniref:Uncharacterized protein n=1 Tax=Sinosporangium album TaxID=504805 RepID=A0A1G7QWF1_9ACTN|nr:hypothetical protein [Sinosporangium album]SDG02793.1 hypothetical protein SAMN05421505_101150 [Sinosporangium album]
MAYGYPDPRYPPHPPPPRFGSATVILLVSGLTGVAGFLIGIFVGLGGAQAAPDPAPSHPETFIVPTDPAPSAAATPPPAYAPQPGTAQQPGTAPRPAPGADGIGQQPGTVQQPGAGVGQQPGTAQQPGAGGGVGSSPVPGLGPG